MVWVQWQEEDNSPMKWIKAKIHRYTPQGKSLAVMPEGASQESNWIPRKKWDTELKLREEGELEAPETPRELPKTDGDSDGKGEPSLAPQQ